VTKWEFIQKIKDVRSVGIRQWGIDILSNRGVCNEFVMAEVLGHEWNSAFNGHDAIDENRFPTEYKTSLRNSWNFNNLEDRTVWDSLSECRFIHFGKFYDLLEPETIYRSEAEGVLAFMRVKFDRGLWSHGNCQISLNQLKEINYEVVWKDRRQAKNEQKEIFQDGGAGESPSVLWGS
jgi:hypothetical protein